MKLSHLSQIVTYMQRFRKINAIYRVADNTLKIAFDQGIDMFFDMRRGNAHMFISDDLQRSKVYQAPFDVVLTKQFNRSNIISITQPNDDKIIRIKASTSSAYRKSVATLQLEFTGKHTNAIILDEEETVLEALRHIDIYSSYRVVKVGHTLKPLEKPDFTAKEYPLDDVESFLRETYVQERDRRLELLKDQKVSLLLKRIDKLQSSLDRLEDEQHLQEEVASNLNRGNLILANMHLIKPYMAAIELKDFEDNPVTIEFPPECPSAAAASEHFFKRAKKAKQKMQNLHIERSSLNDKIMHLKYFIQSVKQARTVSDIDILFPPQIKGTKNKENQSIETFWIEGYKVMLGKNERGNIELLERARARDIWLHLKDRPSTHVIIVTDKQSVPETVIASAAKLCVDFSLFEKGRYLVDYTPRREVKIQEGANVLYNNYQTIQVEKA